MANVNRKLRTRIAQLIAPPPVPLEPVRYLDAVTVTDYVRDNKAYNIAKKLRDEENEDIKKKFADGYQCPLTTPFILWLQTSTKHEPDWKELYRAQLVKMYFKKLHKMKDAIKEADEKMAEIKEKTPATFVSSLKVDANVAYVAPVPVEVETYA